MHEMNKEKITLVTGATGYIGGRLVPNLLEAGYRVRVLTRDSTRLRGRSWEEEVDIIQADVLKPETLPAALENGISDRLLAKQVLTGLSTWEGWVILRLTSPNI